MNEFSDATNRTIIIIAFFFFYIYVKYTQTQLKLTKNKGKIQCNPLEMVVGSMIDEEQANKTFEACMNYTTAENITENQAKLNTKFNKDVQNIVDKIDNANANDAASREEQQKNLVELLEKKAENIDQLVSVQSKVNQSLQNSYGPFQNLMSEITKVSGSAKDLFQKINNRFPGSGE
jgi:membrane-associated HD superfamily phosphohydrolase|tara:strand:+ start:405 stop:935 length:531 start_codon:yes stop_codon:yes gene_type:complete